MSKSWSAAINAMIGRVVIALGILCGGAGLCAAQEQAAGSPSAPSVTPVPVVVTFSILGDFVRAVGGDKVAVTELVGPGADVHTYEPSPQDAVKLVRARVIFENGLHFEPWLDKLYDSSQSTARRIVTSEGVEPIVVTHGATAEPDPHIWQDMTNAMVMVEQVRDGLIEADRANEAYYTERAEQYLTALGDVNLSIIDILKDVPDERRVLVTIHGSFAYFAKRYGFKVIGAGVEAAASETADPSAAAMAKLADDIRSAGITVVFTEQMANDKTMQAVAAEAKARVAAPLYADSLGPAGTAGDTYIKMMRYNADVIAQALK